MMPITVEKTDFYIKLQLFLISRLEMEYRCVVVRFFISEKEKYTNNSTFFVSMWIILERWDWQWIHSIFMELVGSRIPLDATSSWIQIPDTFEIFPDRFSQRIIGNVEMCFGICWQFKNSTLSIVLALMCQWSYWFNEHKYINSII